MVSEASERREQARDEAAAWVVRLAEPHMPQVRRTFEAWRIEHIEHEIAFERALAAWERADRLRALRSTHFAADEALRRGARIDDRTGVATPAFTSDSVDVSTGRPPRRRIGIGRRGVALAASLAFGGMLGGVATVSFLGAPAYATSIGERRLVILDDGSRMELNTDSKVVVRFSRSRRVLQLVRGEALVHVVHEQRPFRIETASALLDTAGATLSARQMEGGVQILVQEGSVMAAANGAGASRRAVRLTGDTSAVFGETQVAPHHVDAATTERLLAWRDGAISLSGQTLSAAAAEFNRYNLRKITVDPAVGTTRVAGFFQTSDTRAFVTAVTQTFPVRAVAGEDGAIHLSRRQ